MILRLSTKLATKIHEAPKVSVPPNSNPYADWSATLLTADRTQYVLLANTASLYSVVTFGRGITDYSEFIDAALTAIREYMVADGLEFVYRKFVVPASGEVSFSKALSRSVTGSMNDLVRHATFWLVERELSPFETSSKLNEMPMSALGYKMQREVFKELGNDLPTRSDK